MQSKTPLLMVTALVCGLGAAFGTWKLVSGAQAQPTEDKMVKVLVPVQDIPSYYLFQDVTKFTEKEFPRSKLRESEDETITNFEQIKNKTSRHYKLRTGEPVYKNDICDSVENDIIDRLRTGEEAVGLSVNPDDGGGFIRVGDRVDIAASITAQGGEQARTQYILEAIEILAVDSNSQKVEVAAGQVTPPSRFLLRVTRQQALVLRFYKDNARLAIFKRKPDDPQTLGDTWIFSWGKKASSAQGYQEEPQPATTMVALQETKLAEPASDDTKPVTAPRINNGVAKDEPGWDILESTRKHKVVIDDGGQRRVIGTNEDITEKKYVPKSDKKEENKDGKEEKKNNTGT